MTVALTNWEPYILPEIPAVPDPALQRAVRDAAIDFCKDTLLWKEWLDRISIVEDDDDYSLTAPAAMALYADIQGVYQVFYKEDGAADDQFAPLDPTTEDDMEAELGSAWMFATAEQPSKYYMPASEPTTLYLYPIPTVASASGLLVRAYCKPLETATVLPDFLFNRHKNAIKYGALAKLFGAKGMPWYDLKEQSKWLDFYTNERDNTLLLAATGSVRKEQSVRMRNWI
jgi:hypothetical protein